MYLGNVKDITIATAIVVSLACLLCAVMIVALKQRPPFNRDRFKMVVVLLFFLTLLLTTLYIV